MPRPHKEEPNSERTTATRSFWSGTISFGLVSVPVDLLAANRGVVRGLRMLGPEGQPLKRKYLCAQEGTDVNNDELVRGYEVEPGQFVTVTDEELEALEPDKSRDIDLNRFVPKHEISAAFFERGYFLVPAGTSNKAYRLLAHTMEKAGRAGIGTFVMRGKAYVMAIFAENGVLHGQTLRFYDELRTPDDIGVTSKHKGEPKLVAQMTKLINANLSEAFSPDEIKDEDEATVRSVAEEKYKKHEDVIKVASGEADADASEDAEEGEGIADAPEGKLIDLMEVLRRRLAESEAAKPSANDEDEDEDDSKTRKRPHKAKPSGQKAASSDAKHKASDASASPKTKPARAKPAKAAKAPRAKKAPSKVASSKRR